VPAICERQDLPYRAYQASSVFNANKKIAIVGDKVSCAKTIGKWYRTIRSRSVEKSVHNTDPRTVALFVSSLCLKCRKYCDNEDLVFSRLDLNMTRISGIASAPALRACLACVCGAISDRHHCS